MWLTSSSGLGSLYDFYIKPIGKHHIEPPAKQSNAHIQAQTHPKKKKKKG